MKSTEIINEIIINRSSMNDQVLEKKLKHLRMQVARETGKALNNSLAFLKFNYRELEYKNKEEIETGS